MKLLSTILFIFWWPAALWLIPCSLISFIEWHNYFIYPISDWYVEARVSFMAFYLCGILVYVYFLNVVLDAENNINEINNTVKILQSQLHNTEFDERTYDFMQGYLIDHGFADAADELKHAKKFFTF